MIAAIVLIARSLSRLSSVAAAAGRPGHNHHPNRAATFAADDDRVSRCLGKAHSLDGSLAQQRRHKALQRVESLDNEVR